jgi:hypothetical protein
MDRRAMSEAPGRPPSSLYLGLLLVTLATLMFEILLTRIFSVTMVYHFAFMAISIAMFGMTVGAVLVYSRPRSFSEESAAAKLAEHSLWFALAIVSAFAVLTRIPFRGARDALGVLYLALSFAVIAVPFVFSGITVAVALTKVRAPVHRLYAADLSGAALGCLLLVGTLEITDAASAVLVIGALAALGAVFFSHAAAGRRRTAAWVTFFALGVAAAFHTARAAEGRPLLEIVDSAERRTDSYTWVRWNSHSRVTVFGDGSALQNAAGWGLSEKSGAAAARVRQLAMTIDTWAGTVITAFDGDTRPLAFLKDDVTNLAHHLRRDGDALVVGVGGGRDVLSALVFGQRSVTGVEINRAVLEATTDVFGAFAGRLGTRPGVSLVVDEARSYLARSSRRFDLIQLSLIDTWAATAAGAFVLSESSLYTLEAWLGFLDRLKPRGILTVSRWYYPTRPGEALRSASLAGEALRRRGVSEPNRHVILVKAPRASGLSGGLGNGVATILVSPDPFSASDLATLRRECDRLGFPIMASPERVEQPALRALLGGSRPDAFYASYPLDLSAPTDDRPFFFQMLRLGDVGRSLESAARDPNRHNLEAIRLLVVLLAIVAGLTALCVVAPLLLRRRASRTSGAASHLAFFAAIGLGFMFVEISLMQRLMVMLGHPTYALTVVLFTLLVGTGAGSLASGWLSSRVASRWPLLALLAVLVALGLSAPLVAARLAPATTAVRIAAASAMLLVAGFFMGMPFPLGMRRAAERAPELLPWLWGINGAASVLCSVLAVAVALASGISASFWAGVGCYVIALAVYPGAERAGGGSPAAAG